MFYCFTDVSGRLYFLNLKNIQYFYSDRLDNSYFHLVFFNGVIADYEITIDLKQFEEFERWQRTYATRIKKMA